MDMKEAYSIIAQLGGNRFKSMTGAKDFAFGSDGLTFKIGRNANRINGVRINLESTDEYTVEFLRINKNGISIFSRHEQVYCDQLQELFTRQTGMYTTLF